MKRVSSVDYQRIMKRVSFADDVGKSLATSYARHEPIVLADASNTNRSRVQNIFHAGTLDVVAHGVCLESTLLKQNAIFGTLVVDKNLAVTEKNLLVFYTWGNEQLSAVRPYFLGSSRYLFKINAPRRTRKPLTDQQSLVCRFYVDFRGSRIDDHGEFYQIKFATR